MAIDQNTIARDEQLLELIEVHNAALEKAASEITTLRTENAAMKAEKAAWTAKVPAAVKELVKFDRIDQAVTKQAEERLVDPMVMIDTLIKTANPANTIRRAPVAEVQVEAGQQARAKFAAAAQDKPQLTKKASETLEKANAAFDAIWAGRN